MSEVIRGNSVVIMDENLLSGQVKMMTNQLGQNCFVVVVWTSQQVIDSHNPTIQKSNTIAMKKDLKSYDKYVVMQY